MSSTTHRRDFVRGLALGAAAPALASSTTSAAQDAKKAEAAVEKKPTDDPVQAEIEARFALVLARFGKHKQLDAKAKAIIRSEVESLVRRAQVLRAIPVTNGEGPFPVFHPFRGPAGV